MTVIHKEIKRGGMICTVEQTEKGYYNFLEYKDEKRRSGPYTDEDEATQMLSMHAEQWIDELQSHIKGRSDRGMKWKGR